MAENGWNQKDLLGMCSAYQFWILFILYHNFVFSTNLFQLPPLFEKKPPKRLSTHTVVWLHRHCLKYTFQSMRELQIV
jgi:hypothetical protein